MHHNIKHLRSLFLSIFEKQEYYPSNYASGATAYYSDLTATGNVAWFYYNSSNSTHIVATKAPNALGLYDMSGNVWEKSFDRREDNGFHYSHGGSGASSGSYVRVSSTYLSGPQFEATGIGFRLARSE